MRFLADESCDFAIVRALRDAGHDVMAVAENHAGAEDIVVAELAGRGGVRDRLLPVSARVAEIFGRMLKLDDEGYIFPTTAGAKQIDLSTLSNAVSEIARGRAWHS